MPRVKVGYRFKKANPQAIAWAKQHAGELVTDITETTRKQIRKAMVQLYEGRANWEQTWGNIEDTLNDLDRVKTIAHNEAMRAANEGQKMLWAQAVEDGLLEGDEHMVWVVTPDDKLCDICQALEDTTVPLGEEFPTGGPPAHVNCRCTIGLVP